ncbi:MAG: DNA-binding response regulator [Phycisphaerales bacterium]|nr:MAG: DNA-binding response regulator [Phycisphaerales bacterium]
MTGPGSVEQTRVMVVEDEERLRTVLTEGVREIGFPALSVRSGEDALRIMEQSPCDIAILDLNLPNMDGLKCFEILRERWPALEVIILTGFGTLEAAQAAIRLDVAEFLTKPASLGDLEKALHRAWRRRATSAAAAAPLPTCEQTVDQADVNEASPAQTLRDIEHDCIFAALERHDGNREKAAEELGISVRKLYYRLAEYERSGRAERRAGGG